MSLPKLRPSSIRMKAPGAFSRPLPAAEFTPSVAMQPPFHDGDVKQAGQPALGVGPCRRAELAEDPALRLCPERPRHVQQSFPLPRQSHCLDPPVQIRHTFDDAIALQTVDAARECRLIYGERTLEVSEVGFASASDGRKNTEL